jgi:hypothetical protein
MIADAQVAGEFGCILSKPPLRNEEPAPELNGEGICAIRAERRAALLGKAPMHRLRDRIASTFKLRSY